MGGSIANWRRGAFDGDSRTAFPHSMVPGAVTRPGGYHDFIDLTPCIVADDRPRDGRRPARAPDGTFRRTAKAGRRGSGRQGTRICRGRRTGGHQEESVFHQGIELRKLPAARGNRREPIPSLFGLRREARVDRRMVHELDTRDVSDAARVPTPAAAAPVPPAGCARPRRSRENR